MPRNLRTLLIVASLAAGLWAADGDAPERVTPDLKTAPANTWIPVLSAKSGKRDQPIFVYAPKVDRFIAAAGEQWGGGVRPRHYDTEEFDLSKTAWVNAYPPGMEKDRPVSGPLDEAYAKARAMHGNSGRKPFYKDGDHLRITAGGQWDDGKLYGEYCIVPDAGEAGQVYAYWRGSHTVRYDVARRTWEDLEVEPRKANVIWGSMAYDPVNKEIVHAGGEGGTADVNTWVYSLETKAWRNLEFDAPKQKALHERAVKLCWDAKLLLGAVTNRFTVAETPAEAKADLTAQAKAVAAEAAKLAGDCPAKQDEWAARAAGRLAAAEQMLNELAPKLGGKITPELIAAARAAREMIEQAIDALAVQPPGRARSQIAYDAANKKIVMFGGDGLDRTLSDTWVYDCATRTWAQRWPEKAPAPRAGHILSYLPKAKKIVLAGGYSRVSLPQEIWTYDTAANTWSLLAQVEQVHGRSGSFTVGAPSVNARTVQVGAVNGDDVLVCIDENRVWAAKIDPAGADAGATAEHGVAPGTYAWNRIAPESWERAAPQDAAERTAKLLKELPANTWTACDFPRYAPGARNRWGTTAYDTRRHQFLFWGGGHATSHENDVAHFSVRGGFWTIGFHPDDPIEIVYASQPAPLSFHDRPHVPVHAYRAYAYDPVADRMFYGGRGYAPAAREWDPTPAPGLQWRGVMKSQMEQTPAGVVCYSDLGLFRFDAKAGQWQKLPWEGPSPGGTWCDGPGLCYDSKRDCLWFSNERGIWRYDLATGKAEAIKVAKPKVVGRYILGGEEVYIPGADVLMTMHLYPKPGGGLAHVAWSPDQNKFFFVELPWVEKGKPANFKGNPFSWHDAMAFDAELGLLLINNSSDQRVWVLRLDAKSLKLEEIKPDTEE